jgi:hypothetical protein
MITFRLPRFGLLKAALGCGKEDTQSAWHDILSGGTLAAHYFSVFVDFPFCDNIR